MDEEIIQTAGNNDPINIKEDDVPPPPKRDKKQRIFVPVPSNIVLAFDKGQWTNSTLLAMKILWDLKYSAKAIGERLGFSKNACVGKAHRLNFASRPSPIIFSDDPRLSTPEYLEARREKERARCERYRRAQGIGVRTVPPLPSEVPVIVQELPPPVVRVPKPPVYTPVEWREPVVKALAVKPYGRVIECCYPIGEPGAPGFHMCDEPSVAGRSYCPDHCQIAYIRVRDRREDEAA